MPPPPYGHSAADTTPARSSARAEDRDDPAGTLLSVRVDDHLSSSTTHMRRQLPGESGSAHRRRRRRDRRTWREGGRQGYGIRRRRESARTATLQLELVRLNTSDGQRVRVQTEGFTKQAQKSTKKDAAKIGIGAGLGAAIGAIAGGGKGAAIGAGSVALPGRGRYDNAGRGG